MRRNIIIGIVIVFLLMIGAVYYFFFLDHSTEPEDLIVVDEGIDRAVEEQKLTAISTDRVHSPALSLGQDSVWYFNFLGELFKNNLAGGAETMFDYNAGQTIEKGLWPKSGNDFILKSSSITGDSTYTLYQADAGNLLTLPANIKELAWMPDGNRIVYIWQKDDGKLELQISNSDSTDFSLVAELFKKDRIFPSPNGDYVIVLEPLGFETNNAFEVSLATGEFTLVLDRGVNKGISISPDGNQVLFSRLNEVSGLSELWLYDRFTKLYEQLNLATEIEKTVWSPDSSGFYYALAQIPNEDNLYLYNLIAKKSTLVDTGNSSLPVDYKDMIVNSAQDKLFYINGRDGLLYRLNL